jgi:hypothetical protein
VTEAKLRWMFDQADAVDIQEGLLAYTRYNLVMTSLSTRYGVSLPRVVAAFCATSPNNDYVGNLRSTLTLLDAHQRGIPFEQVQISTYRHCGQRAMRYIDGSSSFLDEAKGQKIRAFYHNIVDPEDRRFVTVDGHMVAAWRGQRLTMKEAIPRRDEFANISIATKSIAFNQFMLPCQVQAIIWFARKRIYNVRYDGQLDLFGSGDAWRTLRDVWALEPFPPRSTGPRPAPSDRGLEPTLGL